MALGAAQIPNEYGKLFADSVALNIITCITAFLDSSFDSVAWEQLPLAIPYFRSFCVFAFGGNGIRGLWELGPRPDLSIVLTSPAFALCRWALPSDATQRRRSRHY